MEPGIVSNKSQKSKDLSPNIPNDPLSSKKESKAVVVDDIKNRELALHSASEDEINSIQRALEEATTLFTNKSNESVKVKKMADDANIKAEKLGEVARAHLDKVEAAQNKLKQEKQNLFEKRSTLEEIEKDIVKAIEIQVERQNELERCNVVLKEKENVLKEKEEGLTMWKAQEVASKQGNSQDIVEIARNVHLAQMEVYAAQIDKSKAECAVLKADTAAMIADGDVSSAERAKNLVLYNLQYIQQAHDWAEKSLTVAIQLSEESSSLSRVASEEAAVANEAANQSQIQLRCVEERVGQLSEQLRNKQKIDAERVVHPPKIENQEIGSIALPLFKSQEIEGYDGEDDEKTNFETSRIKPRFPEFKVRSMDGDTNSEAEPKEQEEVIDICFKKIFFPTEESILELVKGKIEDSKAFGSNEEEWKEQTQANAPDLTAAKEWMEAHFEATDLTEPQHRSLCSHILADAYIQSTNLEGFSSLKMMQHLGAYLDKAAKADLAQYHFANKLIPLQPLLEQAIAFRAKIDKACRGSGIAEVKKISEGLRNILINLKPEERYLMSGGWRRAPVGHAIYYEFIKQPGEDYTLHVFNTGDGLCYHPSINTPSGTQYDVCLEIADIAKEKITEPLFLQGLCELLVFLEIPSIDRNKKNTPTNYSSMDVYESLLGSLGGKVMITKDRYRHPQHDGVCAYEGLMAFITDSLTEEESDRLLHDLELQTLVNLYKHNQDLERLSCDDEGRLLLQYSVEKFARSFNTRRGSIPAEERKLVRAILSIIRTHVDKAYRGYEGQQRQEGFNLAFNAQNSFPIVDNKDLLSVKAMALQGKNLMSKQIYTPLKIEKFTLDVLDMQKFHDNCEKLLKEGAAEAVVYAINDFFLQLPLPDEGNQPWLLLGLDDKQIAEYMAVLSDLAELLRMGEQKVRHLPMVRIDCVVSLYKGLALQHHLASLSTELGEYFKGPWKLPIDEFEQLQSNDLYQNVLRGRDNENKGIGEVFYEAKVRHEYAAICKYFRDNNKSYRDVLFFSKGYEAVYYVVLDSKNKLPDSLDLEGAFIYTYIQNNPNKFKDNYGYEPLPITIDKLALVYADSKGHFLPPQFSYLKLEVLKTRLYIRGDVPKYKNALTIYKKPNSRIICAPYGQEIETKGIKSVYGKNSWSKMYDHQNPAVRNLLKGTIITFKELEKIPIPDCGSMPMSRYQELLALKARRNREDNSHVYHKLQISKTLSFLKLHWHELNDLELQMICRSYLFEGDLLSFAIIENPEICSLFTDFILSTYPLFAEEEEVKGALFVLDIKQLFEDELLELKKEGYGTLVFQKKITETLLELGKLNANEALQKLLIRSDSDEQKSLICRQILSSLATKIEPLRTSDLIDLFVAKIVLQNLPIAHHLQDPYRQSIAEKCMHRFANQLAGFSDNQVAMKEVGSRAASLLLVQSKERVEELVWKVSDDRTSIIGEIDNEEKYRFSLIDYSLNQPEGTYCYLPERIREDAFLKQACSELPPKGFKQGSLTYIFYNEQEQKCTVVLTKYNDIERVEKEIRGERYQWIKCPVVQLQKEFLGHPTNYWHSLEDPSKILVESQGRVIYRLHVANAKEIDCIEHLDKGNPPFTLSLSCKDELPQQLCHMEVDVNAIQLWQDRTRSLREISLPRLGLEFTVDLKDQEKIYCQQIADYKIASRQSVKGFGKFKQYLVLEKEDSKGALQRKAVIPKALFSNTSKGALSVGLELKEPPRGHLVFDVIADERILPTSVEGALYLVDLFLKTKQYEKALLYLRKYSTKLTLFTSEEKTLLEGLSWNTRSQPENPEYIDGHPEAVAIRLAAFSLLLTNHRLYSDTPFQVPDKAEMQQLFYDSLNSLKNSYCTKQAYMTSCLLTLDEEIELWPNKLWPNKEEKINPDYLVHTGLQFEQPNIMKDFYRGDLETILKAFRSNVGKGVKGNILQQCQETSVLRPEELDFQDYYLLAREGTVEERNQLIKQMEFQASVVSQPNSPVNAAPDNRKYIKRYLAKFLIIVCRYPDEFPLTQILIDKIKNNDHLLTYQNLLDVPFMKCQQEEFNRAAGNNIHQFPPLFKQDNSFLPSQKHFQLFLFC